MRTREGIQVSWETKKDLKVVKEVAKQTPGQGHSKQMAQIEQLPMASVSVAGESA